MDLYYKEYGEGKPLIILHGLLGAGGNWHSLSRNVFSRYFRVLAVDLRNHGRSPHSDVFDFPSMVDDVRQLLDKLGLERAHVLGHSMGGKVAMRLALEHESRLDKLIVVDIAPREYPPHHLNIFEGLRSLDLSRYSSRSEIDQALAVYVDERPVRQFLLKNLASDGSGSYSWKMNLEGIYQNYRRINEAIETERTFHRPVLFIKGERSKYIRSEDEPEIQDLFPESTIVTIPSAGHWVHAEAPEAFAESAMNFLQP